MNYDDTTFDKVDYTNAQLAQGEYYNCTFRFCNFASSSLSHIEFVECEFLDCDLSMLNVSNTSFRDVSFTRCKMLGVNFQYCNPFLLQMRFEQCQMDFCIFANQKLKRTSWKTCELREVDFSAADLTLVRFEDCDLGRALFEDTILVEADFRTAYNFGLDPELNRMTKAKFAREGLEGLLKKYNLSIG